MFLIDDAAKALYFSVFGKTNVKFIANEITHAATLKFANYLLNVFLDTNPSTDNIAALIFQIEANLLSNRVSFNGKQCGEEAIKFLSNYLN